MKTPEAKGACTAPGDSDLIADIFHGIGQPLTALECGLELALRQDTSVAQFRARMKSALVSAQILHEQVVELRMLLDAGDPGDTSVPVAIDGVLLQLQDDFRPLVDTAETALSVRCKPAMVRGNTARLRSGFFHLFEFLVGSSPQRAITVFATQKSNRFLKVRFVVRPRAGVSCSQSTMVVDTGEMALRIARRTFHAVGGELVMKPNAYGNVDGHVLLQLAKMRGSLGAMVAGRHARCRRRKPAAEKI